MIAQLSKIWRVWACARAIARHLRPGLLHTPLLTKMLSIIIPIVIPSIPKATSCFPNILFFTRFTGQKINQAVIVTVKFLIYFTCFASNIASKCQFFISETLIHNSHHSLSHFVDPTTLSNGYSLALTR